MKAFKENGDATATGLLKQIGNIKFLDMVYLLHDVLPVLPYIARFFRKEDFICLYCTSARVYLDVISSELMMEKTEDYRYENSLSSKPTAHSEGLITNVSKLYIQALKDNLSKQFDGNLPVLTVFNACF